MILDIFSNPGDSMISNDWKCLDIRLISDADLEVILTRWRIFGVGYHNSATPGKMSYLFSSVLNQQAG